MNQVVDAEQLGGKGLLGVEGVKTNVGRQVGFGGEHGGGEVVAVEAGVGVVGRNGAEEEACAGGKVGDFGGWREFCCDGGVNGPSESSVTVAEGTLLFILIFL